MSDLNRPLRLQGLAAFGAGLAFRYHPQISPLSNLDVAPERHIAQMKTVLVRARRHTFGAAQAFIRVDLQVTNSNRAQTSGMRP